LFPLQDKGFLISTSNLQSQSYRVALHHSDQDIQYTSRNYRQRLAQADTVPSISRRSNCYDNAAMESFWSSLKRELVHSSTFAARAKPAPPSSSGSKSFTTGSGFTTPLAINPLWTENQIN